MGKYFFAISFSAAPNTISILSKLFAVLGQNNINIRMIAQGTDEMNIIVGVENEDYEKTVKTIYESFVI